MRKKLKECGGFTMVEMLCAVAILVMLCLLVNSGLSVAMRSYRDIIAESETQLLLNDLSDALSDRLRYAIVTVKEKEVTNDDGTVTTKTDCTLSFENVALQDGGKVENIELQDGMVVVGDERLLSSGAYGSKLSDGNRRYEVKSVTITWDNGESPGPGLNTLREDQILTFYITLEVKDRWGPVSEKKELTVRCMNPVKKEV